jgi:hypothetical protein
MEETERLDDGDAFKGMEHLQILVAGHDHIGFTRDSDLEEFIVPRGRHGWSRERARKAGWSSKPAAVPETPAGE